MSDDEKSGHDRHMDDVESLARYLAKHLAIEEAWSDYVQAAKLALAWIDARGTVSDSSGQVKRGQ